MDLADIFLGICKMITKNTLQSGWGAMSMFVGLRGETEELGIKAQNIWAFTGLVKSYLVVKLCVSVQVL